MVNTALRSWRLTGAGLEDVEDARAAGTPPQTPPRRTLERRGGGGQDRAPERGEGMKDATQGITRRLVLALLPSGLAAGAWLGQAAEARPVPLPSDLGVGNEEGDGVFERDVFGPGVFE
jgi:hypothetical protein